MIALIALLTFSVVSNTSNKSVSILTNRSFNLNLSAYLLETESEKSSSGRISSLFGYIFNHSFEN